MLNNQSLKIQSLQHLNVNDICLVKLDLVSCDDCYVPSKKPHFAVSTFSLQWIKFQMMIFKGLIIFLKR